MRYNRDAETPFYTYGDSIEPAVPEQMAWIDERITRLLHRIEELEVRVAHLEHELAEAPA